MPKPIPVEGDRQNWPGSQATSAPTPGRDFQRKCGFTNSRSWPTLNDSSYLIAIFRNRARLRRLIFLCGVALLLGLNLTFSWVTPAQSQTTGRTIDSADSTPPHSAVVMRPDDGPPPESPQIQTNQIIGIDRKVWECFSDLSNLGTSRERDQGVGCGGWNSAKIAKWRQDIPIKIAVDAAPGFEPVVRAELARLESNTHWQFELVDDLGDTRFDVYVGHTMEELEERRIYCRHEDVFGCATTTAGFDNRIYNADVLVFNLWPRTSRNFNDFDSTRQQQFRSAILHELIHALSRMQHRTEPLSIMNPEVHHRAELSPMDEQLLRLHSNPLIESGMTMDEIEALIVFNDELESPLPQDPAFTAWKILDQSRSLLRGAASADYSLRASSETCEDGFGWADYQIGNVSRNRQLSEWVRLTTGTDDLLALHEGTAVGEYWRMGADGWRRTSRAAVSYVLPGWNGGLSDPHKLLDYTFNYVDWDVVGIATGGQGEMLVTAELDLSQATDTPGSDALWVQFAIDPDSSVLSGYRARWRDLDPDCGDFVVEARSGQFGPRFDIPSAVQQESFVIPRCRTEYWKRLDGRVQLRGNWHRHCGPQSLTDRYVKNLLVSFDGWSLLRVELESADPVAVRVIRLAGEASGDTDPHADGYFQGISHLIEPQHNLAWRQEVLPAGVYLVELTTRNREFPGSYLFTMEGQSIPPPPLRFKEIQTGYWGSCGLLVDGTPICWGKSQVNSRNAAVPDEKLASLARGPGDHLCGVRGDGTLLCWEYRLDGAHRCAPNDDGAIYCRTIDQPAPIPGSIRNLGDVAVATIGVIGGYYDQRPPAGQFSAVSVGGANTCGLRLDGTAECWGNDQYGKSSPPRRDRFTQIAAGGLHTCGLRLDGTARCWGSNLYGQTSAPPGERFVQIGVGDEFSCGLREDGSTRCWGSGGEEACELAPVEGLPCLGLGNVQVAPQPPDGELLVRLSSVDPLCGLRADGSVLCWSKYAAGRLNPAPPGEFVHVSANGALACAVRSDGSPVCWGENTFGQASPPTGSYFSGVPERVPPSDLVAVESGRLQTCALDGSGEISCWGAQWWNGRFAGQYAAVSTGYAHACAIDLQGRPVCRGDDRFGQSSPPELSGLTAIASGFSHSCGLQQDGTAVCWGTNDDGESTPPRSSKFTAIGAGNYRTCAIQTDNTPICWGKEAAIHSQLKSSQPVTAISAGPIMTCYLFADGKIECLSEVEWLNHTIGAAHLRFTSVSAGFNHACGVSTESEAHCWGLSSFGKTNPPEGSLFTAISAANDHTCGIKVDGFAQCWGRDRYGLLDPAKYQRSG